MSSGQAGQRLAKDVALILRGVRSVASTLADMAAAEAKASARSTVEQARHAAPVRTTLRRASNNPRLSPEAFSEKAALAAENATEFARAMATVTARNWLGQIEDDTQKTKWHENHSVDGQKGPQSDVYAPEYELDPQLTSLDLLEKADLTDRDSIKKAVFRKVGRESESRDIVSPIVPPIASPAATPEEKDGGVWRREKKLSSTSRARAVPSGRLSRVASFGSLGVGLGLGAAAEASRRLVGAGTAALGLERLFATCHTPVSSRFRFLCLPV